MATNLRLTEEQLEEHRRTGSPLVVRVGEGSEVVVQDADAYRRMIEFLDEIDLAASGRLCAERWRALQNGSDAGVSAEQFFSDLRHRLSERG
jgi:hypothetical protein